MQIRKENAGQRMHAYACLLQTARGLHTLWQVTSQNPLSHQDVLTCTLYGRSARLDGRGVSTCKGDTHVEQKTVKAGVEARGQRLKTTGAVQAGAVSAGGEQSSKGPLKVRKLIFQRSIWPIQQLCSREVCQHDLVSLAAVQKVAGMQVAMPHVHACTAWTAFVMAGRSSCISGLSSDTSSPQSDSMRKPTAPPRVVPAASSWGTQQPCTQPASTSQQATCGSASAWCEASWGLDALCSLM